MGSLALLAACGSEPTGPAAPPKGTTPDLDPAIPNGTRILIQLEATTLSAGFVFPFTASGKKLVDFSLDEDLDTARPSGILFEHLKPGTYVVQQGEVAGMTFQQIICTSFANRGDGIPNNIIDNATRTVTIQLEAKETVSCAFQSVQQI